MKLALALLFTVSTSPSDATTLKLAAPPPAFELCFAGAHGRCFKTVAAGMFRQYGGTSDSEAFLSETEHLRLHKEIISFFNRVKYSKAGKVKSCSKPFVLKVTGKSKVTESVRCLERLKKTDSEKLLSLVTMISLASKPL